jgi:hypothetical protein
MNTTYDIVVNGHVPPGWSVLCDGLEISHQLDGTTRLTGILPDQTALLGLLLRLRDLGLALVSINPSSVERNEKP